MWLCITRIVYYDRSKKIEFVKFIDSYVEDVLRLSRQRDPLHEQVDLS